MTARGYPGGLDLIWPASDRDGKIGAFITGGSGPIPSRLLTTETFLSSGEDIFANLSSITTAEILVQVKRANDFRDLGEHGMFVYDWSDRYGGRSRKAYKYYPVAAPHSPITVDQTSGYLKEIVCDLKFNLSFNEHVPLDVSEFMDCISKVATSI